MEKLYDRIDWHNNTSPAINETNLNRMSKAVDDIDDRVVDIAGTVMETVPQIQEDLAEAQELIEDAEELTTHPPIIGQNGNWWVWDTSIDDYADSGIDAGVSLTIGETTTLPAGSDATVTNTGTATDPVLNFGIPQGEAGQTGAGVPTGGTTGQVLAKASGTDYDTEWVNASGGSGGHTILNGSGSAMTQRGKLQFVGADVTDDATNDKTIITTTPQSMIGDAWVLGHAYAVDDYAIDGNVLYKCKTAHTSSASYRPPYASYWDAVTVTSQLSSGSTVNVLWDSGDITSSMWTDDTTNNRLVWKKILTVGEASALRNSILSAPLKSVYIRIFMDTSNSGTWTSAYTPIIGISSDRAWSANGTVQGDQICIQAQVILPSNSTGDLYLLAFGTLRTTYQQFKHRFQIIEIL